MCTFAMCSSERNILFAQSPHELRPRKEINERKQQSVEAAPQSAGFTIGLLRLSQTCEEYGGSALFFCIKVSADYKSILVLTIKDKEK